MTQAATDTLETPRPSRNQNRLPVSPMFWGFLAGVVMACIASFGVVALLLPARPDLTALAWLALAMAADLAPVYASSTTQIDLDLPVLLAASVLLGPLVAGSIALLVPDERELRREADLPMVVFNRCQKAIAVLVAGVAAHSVGLRWMAIPACVAALAADWLVNMSLVAVCSRIRSRIPLSKFVREAFFGMRGPAMLGYAAFGLLAIPLVAMAQSGGLVGLIGFLPVLVVARQALQRGSQLGRASEVVESKNRALRSSQEQILRERADERLSIAAALHDEVLQSLHFLTLHAHVVKEDLRNGMLLQLEEDIPALVRVSQDASDVAREIVGELRRSPLGGDDLSQTVHALVVRLRDQFHGQIREDLDDLGGHSPEVQLVAYQIVREAITNSIKHSHATEIGVSCRRDGNLIVVRISDDGLGFEPMLVDESKHFGLSLTRARLEAIGGSFEVDSSPGAGCRIRAEVPTLDSGSTPARLT